MDILEILESNAISYPDKLAYGFIGKEGELTEQLHYQQLNNEVWAASQQLRDRYALNSRIIILLPTEASFIRFFLASLRAELIAVPCPIGYSESGITRILNIISDCAASGIITNKKNTQNAFSAAKRRFESIAGTTHRLVFHR